VIGRLLDPAKDFAKRHWPALRLRTILLTVLLFAAAMPAVGTVFLRVYENVLVRQTEAELVAQGAALAATAEAFWPGAAPFAPPPTNAADRWRPEPPTVDLSGGEVLPERRAATRPAPAVEPAALAVAARLSPVVERTRRTTLASVLLLDQRGVVTLGYEQGGSHAALPEVRAALAGRPSTVLRRNGAYRPKYDFEWLSRASGLRLHHARPVVVNGRVAGVLLLSRSPRALFKGLYQDRIKLLIGLGAIGAALVVLSGLVSRGVTRPVERLSAASRALAAGRGEAPETPPTAAVEIRELYDSFRAMAEAIEGRSRYLRDFAAAVSHEFKTPLAGIRGAVELLEDHGPDMTEEERRRFLEAISADSQRLSQLVGRLLELAKADMARPEAAATADLAAAARKAADAQAGPGFAVEVRTPAGLPPVAAPAAVLETVLGVLLENSRQAGAARAVVEAAAQDGRVRFSVSDDGPGVPAGDRERLFEPFFTSRRSEGGTGLGLPIARSLLAASGATLTLADAARGARFESLLIAAGSGGAERA
jgi:two-component system, OmpR family, sensor histidine kinase ChvG